MSFIFVMFEKTIFEQKTVVTQSSGSALADNMF